MWTYYVNTNTLTHLHAYMWTPSANLNSVSSITIPRLVFWQYFWHWDKDVEMLAFWAWNICCPWLVGQTGDDCVIGFYAVSDWFILTGDDCVIGFSAGVALCAVSDWFILTGGHCVIGFCAGVARCAQTRRTVQSRRLMKTTLRTTPVRTQPMNGWRSCVYLISDTCQLWL